MPTVPVDVVPAVQLASVVIPAALFAHGVIWYACRKDRRITEKAYRRSIGGGVVLATVSATIVTSVLVWGSSSLVGSVGQVLILWVAIGAALSSMFPLAFLVVAARRDPQGGVLTRFIHGEKRTNQEP